MRTESQYLVAALESLLVEKGIISTDAVDKVIETYANDIGPMIGAHIVAHAWKNPEYKQLLLTDAPRALTEMGYGGKGADVLVVYENTPTIHNVVVCTLCSCYPWAVLGLPPSWYKDFAYRSRVVIEPRQVLHEFGLDLDDSVEIRVWDSSAENRYMILPEPPVGYEMLSEEELVPLITRESMIGVAKVKPTEMVHTQAG